MSTEWTTTNYTLLSIAIIAQFSDVISTWCLLCDSGVEGNFIVGPSPSVSSLLVLKIILISCFYMLAEYSFLNEPKYRNRAFIILIILGFGATIWNMHIIYLIEYVRFGKVA